MTRFEIIRFKRGLIGRCWLKILDWEDSFCIDMAECVIDVKTVISRKITDIDHTLFGGTLKEFRETEINSTRTIFPSTGFQVPSKFKNSGILPWMRTMDRIHSEFQTLRIMGKFNLFVGFFGMSRWGIDSKGTLYTSWKDPYFKAPPRRIIRLPLFLAFMVQWVENKIANVYNSLAIDMVVVLAFILNKEIRYDVIEKEEIKKDEKKIIHS